MIPITLMLLILTSTININVVSITTWYYSRDNRNCNSQCNDKGKFCDPYTIASIVTIESLSKLLDLFPALSKNNLHLEGSPYCQSPPVKPWGGPWKREDSADDSSAGDVYCIPSCDIASDYGYWKFCPCSDTAIEELVFSITDHTVNYQVTKTYMDNLFLSSGVFRRKCYNCDSDHTDIYYKRLTPIPPAFSFYDSIISTFSSGNNILNTDFALYQSFYDFKNNINWWQYCNYNDVGVGFPRDCGPTSQSFVSNQFTSLSSMNSRSADYFISLPPTSSPTSDPSCIRFNPSWTSYNTWVSYSGGVGFCRAIPSYSYHPCSSNALVRCESVYFWGQATGSCEVAMCPPGALLGPRTNGPSYSNPGYYSDNPSCPCYCPAGIYWDGINCATSPIQCAIGYYLSSSTCIRCAEGLTTLTTGATSSAQCGKALLS